MGTLAKSTFLIMSMLTLAAAPDALADVKNLQGKPLPNFKMTSVDGKSLSNANFKGKAMVIDFWATWCGPCKKATPFMQSLHNEFASKGLVVVGANGLEDKPGASAAADYAKNNKLNYLQTHSNDDLMRQWGVVGVPTIMFVDKAGKVRKVYVGFADSQKTEMRNLVAKMVAGQ